MRRLPWSGWQGKRKIEDKGVPISLTPLAKESHRRKIKEGIENGKGRIMPAWKGKIETRTSPRQWRRFVRLTEIIFPFLQVIENNKATSALQLWLCCFSRDYITKKRLSPRWADAARSLTDPDLLSTGQPLADFKNSTFLTNEELLHRKKYDC